MNSAENKQYLVFWRNNRRIGSIEKTTQDMELMKRDFHLMLIGKDVGGTEHYEVLSEKK